MEMAEGTIKVEDSLMGHIGMGRPPTKPTPSIRGRRLIRNMLPNRMAPPETIPLEEAAKRCLPEICDGSKWTTPSQLFHCSGDRISCEGLYEGSMCKFTELQAMPSKTPVSVLQELLSRRGTTPKYELVQVEGAIHEPTFRYTVSVGEAIGSSRFAAMGTGRSKKEAKHAAAKAILDKITGNTESSDISSPSSVADSLSSGMGVMEERMIGNPIGLLQELCMTRRWPPPAYETENEEGLPHERQFTISCLVFRHKEIGTGKSKKIAKRLAAHKMWTRLKDLPCETNNMQYNLDDEDEINQRLPQSEFDSLKTVKIPLASTPYNMKVSQFHKNLKSSSGPKLEELQKTPLCKESDFNPVQFLQEIASEQQFEVTFVDVEEKSVSGKHQSLVQLSTLPVAVCYGTGITSSEAQTSAAYNALHYLKLMTKK